MWPPTAASLIILKLRIVLCRLTYLHVFQVSSSPPDFHGHHLPSARADDRRRPCKHLGHTNKTGSIII